ncbi:MAG: glycosyltransferase [Steroidobacteraceae bacterium]
MIVFLSLLVWIYLCAAHGKFWASKPELEPAVPSELPDVDIVVPARNEAQCIGAAIASLLAQDYAGRFRVILVDDNSTDGTAEHAGRAANLLVIRAQPKPAGWSGKLWALNQGVAAGSAAVLLFTDADVVHDPRHLSTLIARLQAPHVDMVSEMVRLNCASFAERALVPAFVYFFQMLYPFARVNAAESRIAAAAGGTVLIRREALQRIGGIESIKHALIDDVALAKAVKASGPIYLGHSALAASIRPYPRFVDVWRMIARTAFTQLRCSAGLLGLTLLGLTLVWLVPAWALAFGHGLDRGYGLAAYALGAFTYLPTLARYGRSWVWSLALPLIAVFYMAATGASAVNHWCGVGPQWKDRAYGAG